MERFFIEGPQSVSGNVVISGSKNSALPIICASLLTKREVILNNIPIITDVVDLLNILKYLNVNHKFIDNTLLIDSSNIEYNDLIMFEITKIRASYYLMGVFLSLFKKCVIKHPGGCKIGARPIDYHIRAFEKIGFNVLKDDDIYSITLNELKDSKIHFIKKSVGATINTMLASVLNNINVVIENPSLEPEVLDVIGFLNEIGFNINIEMNNIIINNSYKIKEELKYKIISDRVECATFVIMALLCGNLIIENVDIEYISNYITPLINANANIRIIDNKLYVDKSDVNPFDIHVSEYPGFATDIQPLFCTLFSLTNGVSKIFDSIFENRFLVCNELNKMGSKIKINQNEVLIEGVEKLFGTDIAATDLRASAALLIASIAADGKTIISNFSYIHRGYENIYEKLRLIGLKFDYELDK